MTEHKLTVDKVFDLTRQMHSASEQGEWEKVIALEVERRPLLEQIFYDAAGNEEYLRGRVEQIINLDKEISALGESAKQEMVDAFRELETGRQADQAYKKNNK